MHVCMHMYILYIYIHTHTLYITHTHTHTHSHCARIDCNAVTQRCVALEEFTQRNI